MLVMGCTSSLKVKHKMQDIFLIQTLAASTHRGRNVRQPYDRIHGCDAPDTASGPAGTCSLAQQLDSEQNVEDTRCTVQWSTRWPSSFSFQGRNFVIQGVRAPSAFLEAQRSALSSLICPRISPLGNVTVCTLA